MENRRWFAGVWEDIRGGDEIRLQHEESDSYFETHAAATFTDPHNWSAAGLHWSALSANGWDVYVRRDGIENILEYAKDGAREAHENWTLTNGSDVFMGKLSAYNDIIEYIEHL